MPVEEIVGGNLPAIANEQHDDADMENINGNVRIDIPPWTELTEEV